MTRSKNVLATIVTLFALAALGAAALAASGCTAVFGLDPLAPALASSPSGPAQAQAPQPGAAQGATTVAGSSAPSVATGEAVVQRDCIGRCHGSNILGFRTSASQARTIAYSMGGKAGLNSSAEAAVALFLAQ